jgi:exopolysaccharide biosynthesis polyprenyl glycosylphosphotransferase
MELEIGSAEAQYPAGDPVSVLVPATDYLEDLAAAGFPNVQSIMYSVAKRAFDIVFASLAIIITAPLLLVIAIAIKLSSPGPVFFRQERVGRNGRIFNMLKFRTMRVADKTITDTAWRALDDPRRTGVGALLRRTSLDELPQFFNVLRGEMSVVGPRPERPFFVEKFALEIPHYKMRHGGLVGITGLAQIHGYRGDTCIETRVLYDLQYLENWSLSLDLKIVWRTVKGVFFSAHE